MFKVDFATQRRQCGAARVEGRFDGSVEDIAQPRHGGRSWVKILPHLCETQHGSAYSAGEDIKRHELTDCERAINDELGPEIEDAGGDQFADKLHSLTCGVAQSDDAEACCDIACELLLPTT